LDTEIQFVTVARTSDIARGQGRAFTVGDKSIAVFNDEGVFRAIDDMCPHMGASLATGHLDHSIVACPWHGWRFDTRDGTWCDNRRVKIAAYPVQVVGDEVQVGVPIDPPGLPTR
jgi:nitrite reductase (NADH) small subunit/3-phenylpropionate/trans-cinnamate dioxygenase ferredoxin subunit